MHLQHQPKYNAITSMLIQGNKKEYPKLVLVGFPSLLEYQVWIDFVYLNHIHKNNIVRLNWFSAGLTDGFIWHESYQIQRIHLHNFCAFKIQCVVLHFNIKLNVPETKKLLFCFSLWKKAAFLYIKKSSLTICLCLHDFNKH